MTKRMLIGLMFLLSVVLAFGCGGKKQESAAGVAAIPPTPQPTPFPQSAHINFREVWQKNFSEEVVAVGANDAPKAFPLTAIITQQMLYQLNQEGERQGEGVNIPAWKRAFINAAGDRLALLAVSDDKGQQFSSATLELGKLEKLQPGASAASLKTLDQVKIKEFPYHGNPKEIGLQLAPDGSWFLLFSFPEGKVFGYRADGKLLVEQPFPGLQKIDVAFSPDSSFCVVSVMFNQRGRESSTAVAIGREGVIKWKFDGLEDQPFKYSKVTFLSVGNQFGLLSDEGFVVFSEQFKEEWHIGLNPGKYLAAVSGDRGRVFVASEMNRLVFVLHRRTGEIQTRCDLSAHLRRPDVRFVQAAPFGSGVLMNVQEGYGIDPAGVFLVYINRIGKVGALKDMGAQPLNLTAHPTDASRIIVTQGSVITIYAAEPIAGDQPEVEQQSAAQEEAAPK